MNANPFLRKINVVLEKTGLDAYSLQIENSQGIEFYINFPKKKIPPSSSTPHSTHRHHQKIIVLVYPQKKRPQARAWSAA